MYIRSKLSSELPHKKEIPGSYEWWYFDAMSADKKWAIVIIFYEGNPFSPAYIKAQEEALSAKADEVLAFLTISHLADQRAEHISGGQKKLLELGRTMMVDAKIVFLDEVGAGVNRTLLNTIADAILRLNREKGYTFCVIEHDMDFIARLCDPVICMAEGRVLAQGTVDELKNNDRVIEAYLGTGLKNKVAHNG